MNSEKNQNNDEIKKEVFKGNFKNNTLIVEHTFGEIYEFGILNVVIPEMHCLMKRNFQKLPISLKFKFPKKFHDELFGPDRKVIDGEFFQLIFSWYLKKTYELGSYAILESPVKVNYNNKKMMTIIKFNYTVYNSYGVKQWPL